MSSIADFYRRQSEEPDAPGAPGAPMPVAAVPGPVHEAGPFRLALPDAWSDETLHVFAGPVEDGHQHTVTVSVDRAVELDLEAYVDQQVRALEAQLKAFSVARREAATLDCGDPVVRVVFDWHPAEGTRVVQEQLVVVKGTTGYRLTATFTPLTFETFGPEVRAMLLSFEPA